MSVAFALAVVALGLSIFASRKTALVLTGSLALPPFGPGALTGAIFVSIFLGPFALVARAMGSFDAGLAASALMAGIVLAFVVGKSSAPLPRASGRTELAFGAVVLLLVVVYAYLAWRYQMHDEHAIYGHKSMIEQFRRGVYPLYYPSLPGEEARYHYGFDILGGVLARAFGASSDHSIDLVMMGMVILMAWGAAAVATDEGAERSAPLAAAAIHLGGGLAFVLLAGVDGRHPRCLSQYHHPSCGVELFPTQFMNVFQHPVSVGVPLFLVWVLLAPRIAGARTTERLLSRRWWAAAGVALLILSALSIGQLVYYALGVLAALAAVPLWRWSSEGSVGVRLGAIARGWGALALVCGVSFGVARLMGGMLAPNPSIDPGLVVRRAVIGFPENEPLLGILWHHAVNLGLGFLLIPVFAVLASKKRSAGLVMLLAFALGGIAISHLWVYLRSWDIVKFPSAASYALSLAYVVTVDRALAARSGWGWRWARRSGAAALMGTGITAAAFVVWPLQGELRLYDVGKWGPDPMVERTIDWFRGHDYQSADVIYAQSNVAKELSVFGGLSVVAQDSDLFYMGVRLERLTQQKRLAERVRSTMDQSALQALGVRWIVLSDEEVENLGGPAKRRIREGAPYLELTVSLDGDRPGRTRRVYRVVSPPPVAPPESK